MITFKKHFATLSLILSVFLSSTPLFAARQAAQDAKREAAFEEFHKNLDRIMSSNRDGAAGQMLNIKAKQQKLSKTNWKKAEAPQLEHRREKERQHIAKHKRQKARATARKDKMMQADNSDDEIQHNEDNEFETNA